MDIKELLHRIHILIEEYLKEENIKLKEENIKLKEDLQEAKDIADEYLEACNDARDTLASVINR